MAEDFCRRLFVKVFNEDWDECKTSKAVPEPFFLPFVSEYSVSVWRRLA